MKNTSFSKPSKSFDNKAVMPSCTLPGMPNSISRPPLLTLQSRARFPRDPLRAPGDNPGAPRNSQDPPQGSQGCLDTSKMSKVDHQKSCKYKHWASKEHEQHTLGVFVKVLGPPKPSLFRAHALRSPPPGTQMTLPGASRISG